MLFLTKATGTAIELSDWLSVIAIIVSILTVAITFYLENRRLKRESDAKFFQDIYFSYMKLKIPQAESKLRFNHDTSALDGISDILLILKNLRKKTSPYKFLDKDFYERFVRFLEETEDFYSVKQNTVRDSQKFDSFIEESRKKLTDIYGLLNKKFQNKK